MAMPGGFCRWHHRPGPKPRLPSPFLGMAWMVRGRPHGGGGAGEPGRHRGQPRPPSILSMISHTFARKGRGCSNRFPPSGMTTSPFAKTCTADSLTGSQAGCTVASDPTGGLSICPSDRPPLGSQRDPSRVRHAAAPTSRTWSSRGTSRPAGRPAEGRGSSPPLSLPAATSDFFCLEIPRQFCLWFLGLYFFFILGLTQQTQALISISEHHLSYID